MEKSPVPLLLACVLLTSGQSSRVAPAPASLDQLYQSYAAGDHEVVARTIRSASDVTALNLPAAAKLRKWLGPWDRTKAAFVLELAVSAATIVRPVTTILISEGRLYVISRPTPLGTSESEDAFETAWHRAAVGQLQELLAATTEEVYLDTLQRRYAARPGQPRAIDSRFTLARGIAGEQECWLNRQTPPDRISLPTVVTSGAGNASVQGAGTDYTPNLTSSTYQPMSIKQCLEEAVRRFNVAAALPEVAAESKVRGAWMQHQLGSDADALKSLDNMPETNDEVLKYFSHLFRGRILDALHRDADAAVAYRVALDVRPSAQSAAIGLALTLFKSNQIDEARTLAAATRGLPVDSVDPWWTYLGGDGRFIPRFIADVRQRLLLP